MRFNEVDSLGITWHGHYVRYFEDGREAFGEEHGLRYLDFYHHGLATPIVSLHCDYKKPLRYGETALIETRFLDNPAAKIHFDYRIFNADTHELVASGTTVQVFLDIESRELLLNTPAFFENWKLQVQAHS
ncbi:acyl-CoA thioesterase [Hymenobacter sp. ASUV-10]|uniref:Acyl-CoA thioesterase n=1 Tax=Hymenobacter aranciens TaxID=3063996 RepID=A0ABT9BH07_9BACT|nr:acyl-CoA thioesterase [Hymenobacter sp. ASUV-10]MDO7875803.1 acyl-CoA thioesterase [Hymenobacter sp. ASUV-10]